MKKIRIRITIIFIFFSSLLYAQSTNDFITTWQTTTPNETITIPTNPFPAYSYSVNWGDASTDLTTYISNATHIYTNPGTYTVTISGIFPSIYFNNGGDKEKIITIEQWGTGVWTTMQGAFYGCTNLTLSNAPGVGVPVLTSVSSMFAMFAGATAFNGDIGSWNVSNITNMRNMFASATSFNKDIDNWNVSKVTRMDYMFSGATAFNQDIGVNWNVSNVTNMRNMFESAISFDQNIGNWNVSKVTRMDYMFSGATDFNQDIGGNWNVSKVTRMDYMFSGATSFNQNIGDWNVSNVTDMTDMFLSATLSTANYDALLIGWNAQTLQPNVAFHGGNSTYCTGKEARANMIAADGWTIADGGTKCINQFSPPDDATNVSVTTDLAITFTITMVASTGNITIYDASDNSVVETIAANSTNVTIVGNVVTINPTNDLEKSENYYVQIDANAFEDTAGNDYAGISDTTTWNFATVPKTAPTITFSDISKVYGDTDFDLAAMSNSIGTISYSIVPGGTGTATLSGTNNKKVTLGNVGTVNIRATIASDPDYFSGTKDIVLTITPKAITITADSKTKIYGGTDPVLTYQITTGSLETGDTLTGNLIRVAGEDVGIYAINQGTLDNTNYNITYVSANLTITPKAITITADSKTKVYGGTDPVLTYQITTGSLETGDTLTGSITRVAGENVGIYAINQGTLDNTNYNITYVSANLTITKKSITITADPKTKVYGDLDPVLTYQITTGSLETGDTLTGNLIRVAGEDVGNYAINQATLDNTNYNITYVSANLTITKKSITITADSKTKVYGGTDPVLTYQITTGSLETGDTLTGSITRVAGEDVGIYAINQGTLDNTNYNITYVSANLTITPKAITITADSKTKIYGGTDPVLTYQITTGSLETGDTLTGSITRVAGEDVGNYAINQGTLDNTNYNITYVSANLTITPKAITITADSKTKVYGGTDPVLTYQITTGSLETGDTLTGSITRVAGEDVGNYAINQGTLDNTNYNITYVSANLTITPKAITITADSKTKVYGDLDPVLTYQITTGSLETGDTLTGSITRVAGEDVGIYAINQGTLDNTNYNITYVSANLTITKKSITITADSKTKVYGGTDPVLTYQITTGSLETGDTLTGSITRVAGEDVGNYAINQGTLDNTNYNITYVSANLTITPKAITITADSKTKIYGGTDPVLTYQITTGSLETGDTLTGSITRVAGEDVGIYAINQGTLDNTNYNITYVSANLTITKKSITITADSKTKVYGGTDPVLTYQITTGSLETGDTLTGSITRVAGEDVGNYAINQGTLDNTNYNITYVSANLTITPKAITITADSKTKVYGGTDPVLTYQITTGSLETGDTLTGSITRVAGEDVGNYAINQGTLDNTNYNITYVSANLTITKKSITITADSKTKVYGGTDPVLTYQITTGSLETGDTLTGSITRVAGENVGIYAINQGTLDNTNYNITYVSANLTITKKSITITADPKTKVYGDLDPVLTYQITTGSLETGDTLTGSITRVAGEDVGIYAINQGTLDNTNYNITYVSANLTITKKSITITADSKTKVYGGTDPVLTYQITTGSLETGDTLTGSITRVSGEDVGIYAINQGTLDNTNYNITYVSANLTITKKAITITADSKTKVYGATDPVLTYQITTGSLETGDTLTGSITRVAGEDVGNYAINQGTLDNTNYNITYVSANLTITKKSITITADPKTKVYGDLDPVLTYQITTGSLETGDTLTGSITRVAGEDVGNYAINQGTLDNTNYNITYVSANLTITKKSITITADSKTKVYGGTDPVLTYQITTGSLETGDTLTGSITRVAGEDVGNYAINQGTLDNTNYNITYVPANLTITPKAITITADPKTKVYGDLDPVLTYQITTGSLETGDTLTGSITRVAGEDVGIYAINQGTLDNTNYNITYVPANLTITPKAITITADPKTKVYGATDPVLTYQITTGSLETGDTLTGSITRVAGEDVGNYAINQGTLDNTNYNITYVSANLTITPKAITITADSKTKVYGGTDPVLTYQITTGSLETGDTLTGSITRVAGENVGIYAINQGTLDNTNYNITYVSANLTITKKSITITADPKTKVYGDLDPVLTYQITTGSLETGDTLTGSITRVAGEDVGIYAINQGTLDNTNYNITYVSANLTITKKSITITADSKTKVYGGTDPVLTYQITTGSLETGDTLTGSITRVSGEDVGIYAINQGTLDNTNYNITYVSANLTITKKAITITADSKTKVYGATDPVLTYQITTGSLETGDTLTGSITRVAGEDVGNYAINQGTLDNTNYNITYVSANLTITPKAITITADSKTKVYGGTDPVLTYQITTGSLETGDTLTGSITRVAGEDVGNYAINQGTLDNTNYNITYVSANLTITKKAITITADSKTKVYGGTDPVLTYQITTGSLETGDTLTGSITRVAGEDVGNYAINQGTLDNTNYNITYVSANLTITKKSITITADSKTKVYGATDPVLTYQITTGSLETGDTLTGSITRVAGEDVGNYAINQGTLDNTNYNITYISANLTITSKAITITADSKTKVYGGTDPVLTYQITTGSLETGDTLTGSITRVAGEDVGNYAINQGTLDNTNYNITYVSANLTITPKAITITADSKTKIYGGTDPVLTYQITTGSLETGDTLTGSITRVAGEDVGIYAINQGTLDNTNYNITYVSADFTIITGAKITITADAKTKVYGEADPVLTYKITNGTLQPGDVLTGNLTRVAGEDVGIYAINQGTLDNTNYNITYVSANLTITPKEITITAEAITKDYGTADPVLTYTVSPSLELGDTLTGDLERDTGENIGVYTIHQGTLENLNYTITYIAADFTISIPENYEIPNIFTPDNDGINDLFAIKYLEKLYPNFEIIIYNRSAVTLFNYKHTGNPDDVPNWWDGVHKGRKLPTSVYYYYLNFNDDKTKPKSSWVYLKR